MRVASVSIPWAASATAVRSVTARFVALPSIVRLTASRPTLSARSIVDRRSSMRELPRSMASLRSAVWLSIVPARVLVRSSTVPASEELCWANASFSARYCVATGAVDPRSAARERFGQAIVDCIDLHRDDADALVDAVLKRRQAGFHASAGIGEAIRHARDRLVEMRGEALGGAVDLARRVAEAAGNVADAVAQAFFERARADVDRPTQRGLAILKRHFQHADAGRDRGADGGRLFGERAVELALSLVQRDVDGIGAIFERRLRAAGGRIRGYRPSGKAASERLFKTPCRILAALSRHGRRSRR